VRKPRIQRSQAIERRRESRLAHPVVDDVAALTLSDLLNARGKVLLAVVDDVVTAVPVRELDLLGRADRADDGRAKVLGPLRQDAANATGGGLHKDCVPRLDAEGATQQKLRCQALQHHRRGGLELYGVGQVNEEVRGNYALFGIAPKRLYSINHAVALGEFGDVLPNGENLAGPLLTRGEGHAGRRKDAAAQVGIDEVNSDRPISHADLAGFGIADVNVLVGEHIWPAVAVNANCFHGFRPSRCVALRPRR
jgi:hypothetical protein